MNQNPYYRLFILIVIITALSNPQKLFAQCGITPTSGTVTIAVANNVVNTYYSGALDVLSGATSITVGPLDARGNATPLAAGDLILIIQIQGADIDASNTDSYGDNVSGGQASGYLNTNVYAGAYEYNSVAGVAGSVVNLSYTIANNYYHRDFSTGSSIQRYEIVRVPRYYNFTIKAGASVTAPAWNGSTGGIVVIEAANVFKLSGSIDVNSKGFRGGGGKNLTGATAGNSNGSGTLTNTDYRWESPITNGANLTGGAKGEGIAGTPAYYFVLGATTTTTASVEGYLSGSMGRGAAGNAGGGSTDGSPVGASTQNQYNSGGGGGANGGTGGNGGSGWHGGTGDVNTYPTGGFGGSVFAERSIQKFVLGGGGGAGSANNSLPSNEYSASGGSGGGIILTRAKSYSGTGTANANGSNAPGITGTYTPPQTDAAGGGGAGGSIVMVTSRAGAVGLNSITASAKGGEGGDMTNYYDYGPGGGGGGGVIITNGTFLLASVTGGGNGQTASGSPTGPIDNDYGATPGSAGVSILLPGPPPLENLNDLSSPCGVLPVTLTSFTARWNNLHVDLNWHINNEINLSSFELQYSNNGTDFSKLTSLVYHKGISDYSYSHMSPINKNFYRLKINDIDGRYFYSKILSVQKNISRSKVVLVYPNPAYSDLTVQVNTTNSEKILVQVIDNSGRALISKSFNVAPGQNYLSIDGIEKLPPATYILKVKSGSISEVEKIVIGKK
ncbi:MAG: T9SS type A sorting domain-containing protein [Ginsengibacter sp.]